MAAHQLAYPVALLALMLLDVTTGNSRREIARPSFRVHAGTDDDGKYPYVVVIAQINQMPRFRACTGSLIASDWVLTAAHCIKSGQQTSDTRIFYADLSKMPNSTFSRRALQGYPHQNFHREHSYRNDIGLVLIERLDAVRPGLLSATDYLSLTGHSVQYVGGGSTKLNANHSVFDNAAAEDFKKSDFTRPLQVGEAVIEKCNREKNSLKDEFKYLNNDALWICLRAKKHNEGQKVEPADAGGPVIYKGKIIGVCSTAFGDQFMYMAVSPYLDWIQGIMTKRSDSY